MCSWYFVPTCLPLVKPIVLDCLSFPLHLFCSYIIWNSYLFLLYISIMVLSLMVVGSSLHSNSFIVHFHFLYANCLSHKCNRIFCNFYLLCCRQSKATPVLLMPSLSPLTLSWYYLPGGLDSPPWKQKLFF